MTDESFSFRWNISIPDAAKGFVSVPCFVLRDYIQAGVTRQEFLVIIHLAARHFETKKGQSSPSLQTIAQEMGYSVRGLQKVVHRLEQKGMVNITERPGRTSVYDFSPLARACLALWQQYTPELEFTPTPELEFTPPLNSSSPETEQKAEEDKHNNTATTATSTAAVQGNAVDVVVSQSPERAEAARALSEMDVDDRVAGGLLGKYTPERIIEVCRAAEGNPTITSKPGWVVTCLREGWEVQDPEQREQEASDRREANACYQQSQGACGVLIQGYEARRVCKFCPGLENRVRRSQQSPPPRPSSPQEASPVASQAAAYWERLHSEIRSETRLKKPQAGGE